MKKEKKNYDSEWVETIASLIETKREDECWDFKQEHHQNKAELVHDILCMANNRPRRDSYIIYGIDDKSFEILGVENDKYRRNQQCITDLLRNINFAGDKRPKIEVHTVIMNKHEVDVLVIKDSSDVPFYLEKDYGDSTGSEVKQKRLVRSNYIYSRVVDNNTPIDKQADINDIEFLWRKHFGMELPIIERLNILLNETENWNVNFEKKSAAIIAFSLNFIL